jgi:c-di-GMP-binding flagellar brake protein YcgR
VIYLLGLILLGVAGALIVAARRTRNRREHLRLRIPLNMPLHCIPDNAFSFEAQVVDISLGGLGAMVREESINLQPGTILKGCKLVIPNRETVRIDIEVRNNRWIVQPGTGPIVLMGVRFLGKPDGIDSLVGSTG